MSRQTLTIDQIKADVPYACVGGPFGSELTTRDYVDEGIPVIRGSNLPLDRAFLDDEFVFVSEQKANALISNLAYPGDLIFTQRGTLGQIGLIPEGARFDRYVVSQSQMKLTVDCAKAIPLFIYYYFRQPAVAEMVKRRAITSGVPHINLGILKSFEIVIPSVGEQNRIAERLVDIDSAIENNRRRIQLLEQSARLLYKEWFVHLRFPGHEHVKVVDGMPKMWHRVSVSEVIAVNPPEKLERGKDAWYVPMSSLSEAGMTVDRSRFERRETHTSIRFRNGDVLLARITPCLENGKTAYVYFLDNGEVGCGSTEFIVLRGREVSPYFVYCLSRTHDFRGHAIKSMIGSSGRQRVQTTCFDDFLIGLPPTVLQEQFDQLVVESFNQIGVLERQNEGLRRARDLLLPRLMSGEIEV